jgi:hypothetical protein
MGPLTSSARQESASSVPKARPSRPPLLLEPRAEPLGRTTPRRGAEELEVGVVEPVEDVLRAQDGMLAAPRGKPTQERGIGLGGGGEIANGDDGVVEALEHGPPGCHAGDRLGR